MKNCYVYGPKNLSGEIKISGSKNATLPILFASLLTSESVKLKNVPILKDVKYTIQILRKLKVKVEFKKTMHLDFKSIKICKIPHDITKKTRASIWLLGPLLAKFGTAKISFPGGCKIGNRKIDLHILGLT